MRVNEDRLATLTFARAGLIKGRRAGYPVVDIPLRSPEIFVCRRREFGAHRPSGCASHQVILEWDYITLCSYIKAFDLLVGVWLWAGLGWSWDGGLDYAERQSIQVLLVSITTVQTLTDIW